jgi:hypothetical protein
LYKHSDIWRQDYEDLAAGFFAICTDEYNAVVEAAPSESKPPSTVSQKITPPGLLAARRIIYEMSMRAVSFRRPCHQISRVLVTSYTKPVRKRSGEEFFLTDFQKSLSPGSTSMCVEALLKPFLQKYRKGSEL